MSIGRKRGSLFRLSLLIIGIALCFGSLFAEFVSKSTDATDLYYSFGATTPNVALVHEFVLPEDFQKEKIETVQASCHCINGVIKGVEGQLRCVVGMNVPAGARGFIRQAVILQSGEGRNLKLSVNCWACPKNEFLISPDVLSLYLDNKRVETKFKIFGRAADFRDIRPVLTSPVVSVDKVDAEPRITQVEGVSFQEFSLSSTSEWSGEIEIKSDSASGKMKVTIEKPPEKGVDEIKVFLGLISNDFVKSEILLPKNSGYKFSTSDPATTIASDGEIRDNHSVYILKCNNLLSRPGMLTGTILAEPERGGKISITYQGVVVNKSKAPD